MTVICKHCAQEHDEIGLLACFESQVKCWREERDQIKAWGLGLEQKLKKMTAEEADSRNSYTAIKHDMSRLEQEGMRLIEEQRLRAECAEKALSDAELQIDDLRKLFLEVSCIFELTTRQDIDGLLKGKIQEALKGVTEKRHDETRSNGHPKACLCGSCAAY